jgi:HTH-type transcriptional regulator/antitoxin HigA
MVIYCYYKDITQRRIMTISEILPIYDDFLKFFTPLLKIESKEGYKQTLAAVDQLWKLSSDDELDPYGALLILLAKAIEKYEALDPDWNTIIEDSAAMPADIAMLSTLMGQYGLSNSDFPEIGDSSMVSQVLSGEKLLSRSAIDGLALRFGISGGRFFN